MAELISTREIEPFSFFWQHASAIPGLGGPDRSPDPNYCFHTPYHEYAPGIVMFRATIIGAKAHHGELAMRVHAFRPHSGFDASLVAGSRTPLDGLDGSNLEIVVRLAAVPGVQYALFGYFSEPSDLEATGLSIIAEELGGDSADDYISSNTARSLFEATSVDMPNRLMADSPPRFAHPVSQPLTIGQIESAEYMQSWPQIPAVPNDQPSRWRQAYALQALESYGIICEGATGLLIAPEPLPISTALHTRGCLVTDILVNSAARLESDARASGHYSPIMAAADLETIGGSFDFLVAISKPDWFDDKAGFLSLFSTALRKVLRGGIAIILFEYAMDDSYRSEAPTILGGFHPHRGEIEQLAMRIISHGSDVAQLSFPDGIGSNRAISPICPFGLIIRR